ncbi:hypothetical protein PO124_04470 [Bacillus licheniformis]|nr:hypothetical protein [Bacillus licheniformis]
MHLSVQTSGLLMLFMSGTSVLISPFVGKWIDRSGETQPVLIGSCLMAAGAILLTLFLSMHRCCGKASSLLSRGQLRPRQCRPAGCHVYGKSAGHRRDDFGAFSNMPLSWLDLSSVILGLLFGEEITAGHFQDLGMVMIAVAIGSI